MNATTDTQREADEIIQHATRDLRTRAITLEDWWHITHIAIVDGYLSTLPEYSHDNHLAADAPAGTADHRVFGKE